MMVFRYDIREMERNTESIKWEGLETQRDRQWCMRLMRLTWWFVLLVFAVEVVIFAVQWNMGLIEDAGAYLLDYVLMPSLVHVCIQGVVSLWSRRQTQLCNRWQPYVYISGVSLIAASVAWMHRGVHVSHALFIMPLLLALIYVDRKVLWYAFWLNVSLYVLFVVGVILMPDDSMIAPDDIITAAAVLGAGMVISLTVLDRLQSYVQAATEANKRSMCDSLTQLFNHASFYEQLDEHIVRNAREGRAFCLVIFDIDDFKRINDQYGHDIGDVVLLTLVDEINKAIEGEDIAFRYGGEEFTVLTPRGTNESIALTESVRTAFAASVTALPHRMAATVSAGVCAFDGAKFSGRREFFAAADEALYEAKRTGKNRTILWSPALLERATTPVE